MTHSEDTVSRLMALIRAKWRHGVLQKIPWTMLKQRRIMGTLGVTFLLTWTFLAVLVLSPQPVQRDISANISNFFRIQVDPFFNLHHYKFSLNSKVCDTNDLSILVVVHSKPDFYAKRMTIRETLGTVRHVGNSSLSIVFMLGRIQNKTLLNRIVEESKTYGDIVQGNFIDNYKNMTHKHVMAMHWVGHQCPNAKIIVKIDDDVLINPYTLVNYIDTTSIHNSFHCLRLNTEVPDRNPEGRYHIPYEQYPFDMLPEYCPGFAYITTPEVYRKLTSASRDVRYLNMDDVYVTGVLALKTDVKRVDMRHRIFNCNSEPQWSLRLTYVIFILNERDTCRQDPRKMWKAFKPL